MLKRSMICVAGVASIVSCGQDHGYVYQSKSVKVQDSLGGPGDFELSKQSYKDAIWFMPCDGREAPPQAEPAQIVISGPSFSAVRENFGSTKMIFQGRVCAPITYTRDVVFAIDVSTSMGYKDVDKPANGSCKRLTHLESMIAALPAGSKFGVITFEETVVKASTALFDSKAALYADLTNNGATPIADVICRWDGQSFFDLALDKATDLLSHGRGGQVQKEIVIMSDGDAEEHGPVPTDPTPHLTRALKLAADLKSTGISVGTEKFKVQIAGLRVDQPQVDRFLRVVASPDLNGVAMVDGIGQSATVNGRLNAFTLGILDFAKITYGPIGSADKINLDIKPSIAADSSFRVENGPLVLDRDQAGYEAVINYADTRGNPHTFSFKLNWLNLQ